MMMLAEQDYIGKGPHDMTLLMVCMLMFVWLLVMLVRRK